MGYFSEALYWYEWDYRVLSTNTSTNVCRSTWERMGLSVHDRTRQCLKDTEPEKLRKCHIIVHAHHQFCAIALVNMASQHGYKKSTERGQHLTVKCCQILSSGAQI